MGKLRVNPEHLPHFPLVTKFAGQLRGKTVIVKVDWNATLKSGVIKNPEKIAVAYPTIQYVLGQGGNVILLSHLGRPEKGYEDKFSLAPVHQHVAAQFADYGVEFAGPLLPLALGKSLTTDEYVNEGIYTLAKKLGIGSNARLLLLENVRFAEAEQKKPGEPGYEELAKALLSLSNGIVIHEAAAVWDKSHVSIAGILQYAGLDSIAWGFHAREQIVDLTTKFTGDIPRPYVLHISGTKPEKIKAMLGFLDNPNVDNILVSGNLANGLLEAAGISVGTAAGGYDLAAVKKVLDHPRFREIVLLPYDYIIARPDGSDRQYYLLNTQTGIPAGYQQFDIGNLTAARFAEALARAGTAVNSGVAGAFDLLTNPFEDGTRTVLQGFALAQNKTILGGEGGVAAKQYLTPDELAGIDINVGGGSILSFMATQTCPVADVFLKLAGIN